MDALRSHVQPYGAGKEKHPRWRILQKVAEQSGQEADGEGKAEPTASTTVSRLLRKGEENRPFTASIRCWRKVVNLSMP
ncbi:hypothetical protein AHiyo8_07030 [Arthrobacter sp. Hiyo8]|nr:hypothetical protein AHiyo8_07030 [Arthrobacter sp. Hiyo8]